MTEHTPDADTGKAKGHPDLCPYCRAPISVVQRQAIDQRVEAEKPCTCPVGFGAVVDARCPRHGVRRPAHTITGASR